MGIDDDDASEASEDEWQKLLAGPSKAQEAEDEPAGDSAVPEAKPPPPAAPPADSKPPAAPPASAEPASENGVVRSAKGAGAAELDRPVEDSPLAVQLPTHTAAEKFTLDSLLVLEDASEPEPEEEDAIVVPLKWLDTPSRPTAVKSMPFKPAILLPTDIILEPSVVPPAPKRLAEPKGPPPKASKVAISRPGDLLRALRSNSRADTETSPTQEVDMGVQERYDWKFVVVNFASVGAAYGRATSGHFNWEGVRACVQHLRFSLSLEVVGVSVEGLTGNDRSSAQMTALPADIRRMCSRVEAAESESAGSVKTVELARLRNCRFVSDDLGDEVQWLCDFETRGWLIAARRVLLMRFFFDRLGRFETPDAEEPAPGTL